MIPIVTPITTPYTPYARPNSQSTQPNTQSPYLFLSLGLCTASDSILVIMVSYLSSSEIWPSSTVGSLFLGELVGSCFFGPYADICGRRKSFLLSCTLIAGFSLMSGLTSLEYIHVVEFMVGVGGEWDNGTTKLLCEVDIHRTYDVWQCQCQQTSPTATTLLTI